MKKFDYIMESEDLNECLDCGFVSKTYGELDRGFDEAEVVCPNCGSLHYYITDEANRE
jgi:transcription elongation factor Elf1